MSKRQWYEQTAAEAIANLSSDKDQGLSVKEAATRLGAGGRNRLAQKPKRRKVLVFLDQFKDFMVLVLLAAAVVSGLIGDLADTVTILAIVLLNGLLGYVQTNKAEASLEKLKKLAAPTAQVIRGGVEMSIHGEEIARGDIVLLEAGMIVPADLRLVESLRLAIDESALTGESVPAEKEAEVCLGAASALGDRINMAYMGTVVTNGKGKGLAVGTGMGTEIGLIAASMDEEGHAPTPLERRLEQLGHSLVLICGAIVAVVALLGVLRGESFRLMFLTGISLAVAAIPEGLPAIVTVALAIGVQRMAKRNAIVRHLPAVETLGCATVICSDKTGTLTQSTMQVTEYYCAGQYIGFEGRGYEPKGDIRFPQDERWMKADQEGFALALRAAASCSNARLSRDKLTVGGLFRETAETAGGAVLSGWRALLGKGKSKEKSAGAGWVKKSEHEWERGAGAAGGGARNSFGGGFSGKGPVSKAVGGESGAGKGAFAGGRREGGAWQVVGDPTEGALLAASAKAGIWRESLREKRLDELPFDSDRKMMSVLVADEKTRLRRIYTKGAPDVILNCCNRVWWQGQVRPLTQEIRQKILDANREMAGKALRVLGLAYKEQYQKLESLGRDGEKDLVFLALAGMMDPPREGVAEAVAKCKAAGIRTLMLTGDHKLTAEAVAREIGILEKNGQALTGKELDELNDSELKNALKTTTVFARVSPRHKLRLVKNLKEMGKVCAMTGDGVNDGPAVKAADIGVAMGQTGTDVTREAADLILADDNFTTIAAAVEEGRIIYNNIRRFIRYLLACNTGEVLVMFITTLLGLPLPLVPIQILWVNLVTDGLPAMALGLDPGDEKTMLSRPRNPKDGVFAGGLGARIIIDGILISFATLASYILCFLFFRNMEAARTGAFCTLVLAQLVYVFRCAASRGLLRKCLRNPWLPAAVGASLAMQLAVIYLPFLRPYFDTYPLPLAGWIFVLLPILITTVLQQFFQMVSAVIRREK